MTFDQFSNGLRVLLNIDGGEFAFALGYGGVKMGGDAVAAEYKAFRDDPHRWFIKAPDAKAKAIWWIVAERTKGAEA